MDTETTQTNMHHFNIPLSRNKCIGVYGAYVERQHGPWLSEDTFHGISFTTQRQTNNQTI